jgi:FMN-dependent NADH-azoreductase
MAILLHVDSSPMGEASISRFLTAEFVQRWRGANPQGKVIYRDLTAIPIPVIDAAWISANLTPSASRTQQQNEILALSTELTRELQAADEYAIGIPIHNWGPASSFKLWADQIVRFGETVVNTASGPEGTLDRKRLTVFIAAGRQYGRSAAHAQTNHLEPWLRTFFGSLGVTDMRIVLADGAAELAYGKIDRATFLERHIEAVGSLFTEIISSLP